MKKSIFLSLIFGAIALFAINACSTGKLVGVPDPDPAEYDKTRITVLLKDKITPEMLVSAFEKYGLEKIGPASRTFNEWIFKWTAKINPDVLLKDIQESKLVKEAEFVRLYQQNN